MSDHTFNPSASGFCKEPGCLQVAEYCTGTKPASTSRFLSEVSGQDGRAPDTDTSPAPLSENAGPVTSDYDTSDSSDSGVMYELRDGAWLDSQRFPPLRYAVAGLMPVGLGIIAAPPKAGKSLLILDWLLAVG